MSEYFISWEIELEADSPEAAAQLAHDMQADPDSRATVFTVADEHGRRTRVDLTDGESWLLTP